MNPPPAPIDTEVEIEMRNRLGNETSPYLLQHQHNPVHWWPWGSEAFEAARALDRPIFLSIGYSTCYWCHVMERESFENEAIADYINEHFIPIKVDREERPDVDDIYMTATQLQTGRGGWPMTVFMEPDQLQPFLTGTYFPPAQFQSVLEQIDGFWRNQRAAVLEQANQLARAVREQRELHAEPQPIMQRHVEKCISQLLSSYDQAHGGFGRGPNKFPTPVNIDFLMNAAWNLEPVRNAVLHTLDEMASGGMYDQVGGGFHRYSTDPEWTVPHFEKMLYDNGQLASTYAAAFERTKDSRHAEIVRETLDYILREMTQKSGAFYSAQDAEVGDREGGNYIWTADELRQALEAAGLSDDVDFALQVYGVESGPNYEDPHHPGDPRSVLRMGGRPDEIAKQLQLSIDQFNETLSRINAALLATRMQREQPITDDKILTSWNGLMIAGFADGGRVLGEPKYLDAARRAIDFLWSNLRTNDGGLLHSWRQGEAKINAFLEDYAFLIRGLLALHRATGDQKALNRAIELEEAVRARFLDESRGGYYDTLPDQSDLFLRIKTIYDGATPSGNSVMLNNLIQLHAATGDERYLSDAVNAIEAMSPVLTQQPIIAVNSIKAVDRILKDHPDRLGSSAPTAGRGSAAEPVSVSTSEPVVRLKPGGSETIDIILTTLRGFHVNAHEPGIAFLIPLEIKLAPGSGGGVSIEPLYPVGVKFKGPEGEMLVHEGRTAIPVRITRTGPITGRPALMVRYQACNERECLLPKDELLPMRIVADDQK